MAFACNGCRQIKVEDKGQLCDACVARGQMVQKTTQLNVKKEVGPYDALKRTLSILDAEQRLVRKLLTAPHLVADRPVINKQITEVSKAVEKVCYTMLRYEQAGKSVVNSMNREQQIETIVRWFVKLPAEGKRRLLELLTQSYNEGKMTA